MFALGAPTATLPQFLETTFKLTFVEFKVIFIEISSSKPVSASRTERSYASSVRDINGTSMGTPSINSIDIIGKSHPDPH